MANFVLSIVRGIYRLLFGKIEICGLENIPKDKNFLLAPNHISNFDPPLVAAFVPVKMAYMAKASLFKVPIVNWVIKAFDAFPVKRGGNDLAAIKTAIAILKDGKNLVVFPEGKRVRTPGILGEGKQGAVMIAAKAGAGILPVGIETRYKLFRGVKLTLGEYIDLSEYKNKRLTAEDLQTITNDVLMQKIAELAGAKTYGN